MSPKLKCHQTWNVTKPEIRSKADPNWLFLSQHQTCSQNLIPTLGKSTFIWKYSIFQEIFKYFFYFCGRIKQWKSDFFDFVGQKADFLGKKEDQFRSIFSKRSAIRPRSDKADLLGSLLSVHLISLIHSTGFPVLLVFLFTGFSHLEFSLLLVCPNNGFHFS